MIGGSIKDYVFAWTSRYRKVLTISFPEQLASRSLLLHSCFASELFAAIIGLFARNLLSMRSIIMKNIYPQKSIDVVAIAINIPGSGATASNLVPSTHLEPTTWPFLTRKFVPDMMSNMQ